MNDYKNKYPKSSEDEVFQKTAKSATKEFKR